MRDILLIVATLGVWHAAQASNPSSNSNYANSNNANSNNGPTPSSYSSSNGSSPCIVQQGKCIVNESFRLDRSPANWWTCRGRWTPECYDFVAHVLRRLLNTPACQGHACYVKGSLQYVQASLRGSNDNAWSNSGSNYYDSYYYSSNNNGTGNGNVNCPRPTFTDHMNLLANVLIQKAKLACLLDLGAWTRLSSEAISQLTGEQQCLEQNQAPPQPAPQAYDPTDLNNNVGHWYQYYFSHFPRSQGSTQDANCPYAQHNQPASSQNGDPNSQGPQNGPKNGPQSPTSQSSPQQNNYDGQWPLLWRYAYPPDLFLIRKRQCKLPWIVEKTLRVRLAQYDDLLKTGSKPLPWQADSAAGIRSSGDPTNANAGWQQTLQSTSQAPWQIATQANVGRAILVAYLTGHGCRAVPNSQWRNGGGSIHAS